VDCIRDAHRGSRQGTTPFGGKVTGGQPVVTWTLIALNVIVYVVELVNSSLVLNDGALTGRFSSTIGVADGQWYRLLTSAFIHEPPSGGFGILHIVFNMWALYVVGPQLERLLGRSRFLTIYLVSALGGSVLFYLLAKPGAVAFGASGAIFGLFGAWFVVARRLQLDARMIIGLIAINLVISFTISGIAWQAHIGGLIAGAALTAAYVYAPRQNRTLIQVAATVVLVALLVAGVVWRDEQLVHAVLFRV
jgi:membrane associated rhomboid family serine protease